MIDPIPFGCVSLDEATMQLAAVICDEQLRNVGRRFSEDYDTAKSDPAKLQWSKRELAIWKLHEALRDGALTQLRAMSPSTYDIARPAFLCWVANPHYVDLDHSQETPGDHLARAAVEAGPGAGARAACARSEACRAGPGRRLSRRHPGARVDRGRGCARGSRTARAVAVAGWPRHPHKSYGTVGLTLGLRLCFGSAVAVSAFVAGSMPATIMSSARISTAKRCAECSTMSRSP
jgi:hypothetical protein